MKAWKFDFKEILMEFLGVYVLCLNGGLSVFKISEQSPIQAGPMRLINIAFSHGIALFLMICFAGPISGAQFHPGISLTLALTQDQSIIKSIVFILSQIAGSVTAGVSIYFLKPSSFKGENLGYPVLSDDVSVTQGFFYEFIATFILVFGVYVGIRTKQSEKIIGVWVACALMMAINSIGPMTGASLNPARTIGPAIASYGSISQRGAWIYYVAPTLAAMVAGLSVKYVFYDDEQLKKMGIIQEKQEKENAKEKRLRFKGTEQSDTVRHIRRETEVSVR